MRLNICFFIKDEKLLQKYSKTRHKVMRHMKKKLMYNE